MAFVSRHTGQLGRSLGASLSGACLLVAVTVGSGAASAASATEGALGSRLASLGVRLVQYTPLPDGLRIAFEDELGRDTLLALGLVLKAAVGQASPEGSVEVAAMSGGEVLVQLRTPAAGADACLKQSLSRRQWTQLQHLLGASAKAVVPAPAVADKTAGAPPPASEGRPAGPSAADLARDLIALDLENVRVAWQHNGDLYLQLENRTYRSDVRALGEAMAAVCRRVPAQTQVRIKVLRDEALAGVFSFRAGDYEALQTGALSPAELSRNLSATRDTWGFSWPEATREETGLLNPSRGRVDLRLRPGLEYTIGLERDPLESTPVLHPELVSTVGAGLRAALRGRVVLEQSTGWSIDRALLSRFGAASDESLLWTASVGKFRHRAYGGFVEGQWVDAGDETRLGARGAYLGADPGERGVHMITGYAEREFGALGLTARVTAGQFLGFDDTGALLEVERRFGESSMRLGGTLGLDDKRAMMLLTVPLGPGKADRPRGFRMRAAPAAEWDYNSTLLPVGDTMWDAPDLRQFRGELTLPYARGHVARLAGRADARAGNRWWSAPSFEGLTGLIRTPTADVTPDGCYSVGYGWLPTDATSGLHEGVSRSNPAYATVGFLPGLEMSFRLTFYPDARPWFDSHYADWPYDLDRAFSAQYRVFEQRAARPALAVGSQDIAFGDDSSKVGRASYAVLSRSWDDVRLHLGAGSGRFDGLFGGLEARLSDDVRLLAEHDAQRVNVGLRLRCRPGLTVDGAWLDGKDFGAAISYQGRLP